MLLAVLAMTQRMRLTSAPPPETAPAVEEAAQPAAATAPAEASPPKSAADVQVQEDAAATGLTTVEPDAGKAEAPPALPPEPPAAKRWTRTWPRALVRRMLPILIKADR